MLDIKKLRQQIRSKRSNLTPDFQKQAARKAASSIINTDIFKTSQHIAAYIAIQGEMDPKSVIEYGWSKGKICYFPILTKQGKLLFGEYQQNAQLINNRYHIPEPQPTKLINPEDLDIVITPLVAFDNYGNRLGTGQSSINLI